jgi:tetratricopeptide (TPR) repeat protein
MNWMKKSIKGLFLLIAVPSLISCSSSTVKNREAEYSLLKGVNYSQNGEYEKAMGEYFKSYEIAPENTILLKEMGYNYYQFGDYEKAEEFWLKAFKLTPKDEDLIKNLSTLYYEEEEYEKSLDIIKNSYNLRDNYYQKIYGLINYKRERLQESYNFFKNVSVESYDVETALVYIEVLKNLNKREELFIFLQKIYPYLKDNKEFIIKYSQILLEDFNLTKKSEEILINYLLENGSEDEILLQLSMLYFQMGEKEKARDTFKLISEKDMIQLKYHELKEKLN